MTKLRQIWIPKEFRLPEPEFTREQLDLLEELVQMIGPKITSAASVTKDERAKMVDFLVDLCTGIWRVRRKIDGLPRMPREISDALHSLESMWMCMSQDGVEIVDHIGTAPSEREAKIVEVHEIPDLTCEQVVDVIKPTIILRGEIVQIGEVIVGRPPHTSLKTADDTRAVEPPLPPEEDDETPVPVHEVETITMAPPLRKLSPSEEKTPEEEGPDTPPYEIPKSFQEERGADIEQNSETSDAQRLDSKTAAIAVTEERQNAEEKTPIAAPRHKDAKPAASAKKKKRKKASAVMVADTAPKNNETSKKKHAGRKTRASAAKKSRKKMAAASDDTDITPKEVT
jgi:ssDNA-binding Zn-finger/Zn-ribbon topoisomerase 1